MHGTVEPRKDPVTQRHRPLAGLKVLDLTWHVAGPHATKLLADAGAGVIKVERPHTGDPTRSYGPFPNDDPDPERSAMFLYLNGGKSSIALNLRCEEGRLVVLGLSAWADVLVESFRPGTLEALGLGRDVLQAANPRLLTCSVSSFGPSDPRRGWKATPFILAAAAGTLKEPDRVGEVWLSPGHGLEYQAGVRAANAVSEALTGKPPANRHLEISIVDARALDKRPYPPAAPSDSDVQPFNVEGHSEDGRAAPLLGQHNREVYMGVLGMCPAEMAFLRQTGAL